MWPFGNPKLVPDDLGESLEGITLRTTIFSSKSARENCAKRQNFLQWKPDLRLILVGSHGFQGFQTHTLCPFSGENRTPLSEGNGRVFALVGWHHLRIGRELSFCRERGQKGSPPRNGTAVMVVVMTAEMRGWIRGHVSCYFKVRFLLRCVASGTLCFCGYYTNILPPPLKVENDCFYCILDLCPNEALWCEAKHSLFLSNIYVVY